MGNELESIDMDRPPTLAERVEQLTWWLDDVRRRPLTAGLTVAVCLVVGFVVWRSGQAPDAAPIEDAIPHIQLVTTLPPTTQPAPIIVHVAGAVANPGVYELSAGDRLVDAIEAAGGSLSEGEPQRLNLAALVVDGMQIRVPVEGESVVIQAPGADVGSGPVNINVATAEQLDALPGVGPSTAAAIMSYRDDNGPFASVEELLSVPGIGPAKLDALRDQVVAG